MKSSNEFDELARQKLAERSFPFEEGHWLAAQEALNARRGGNKRGAWSMAALALMLIGGGAWWWAQEAVLVENTATRSAEIQRSVQRVDPRLAEVQEDAAVPTGKATEQTSPASQHADVDLQGTMEPDAPRTRAASSPAPQRTGHASSTVAPVPQGSAPPATLLTTAQEPETEPRAIHIPLPDLPSAAVQVSDIWDDATTTAVEPNGEAQDNVVLTQEAEQPHPASIGNDGPIAPVLATEVTSTAVAAESASSTTDEASSPIAAAEDQPTAENPLSKPTHVAQANDTADTAVPEAVQLPLAAQDSPWEVGVLAGLFSSTSAFQGANSADWNDAVTRQRGTSIGAELMHMGSNFGVGLGLHYNTYAERIAVGEVSNTQVDIDRFWYLRPVDTTILFITDTIVQGGDPYYVGESVTTTIDILTEGFDTTTTITQQRAARALYNRVSYVEIPLLLDAHLVQGRWSLGLRGGPTLGVLTGRRGALPNSRNDGYTEFGDQAFRELVVGYTARAYIRYRWNSAWSIGVEPAIRGQLMNSLGDGPLERRSSAFGGMLSLSYRLR